MSLRVLLADDHRVFRDGLRELLKRSGATVVGEASDGREAVRMAAETVPDTVILRDWLPVMNAEEASRQILSAQPDTSVIVVSAQSDRRSVLRMLRAGASGYVLETDDYEEVYAAVRAVAKGGFYLSSKLDGSIIRNFIDRVPQGEAQLSGPLTYREREVLQLVAEGNTTRQIAESLHVSAKTVETHRRRIMKKLDIHTVALLTKYAVREGLTSL
jgi:DNA-binding NarL/FixJ family response regulator